MTQEQTSKVIGYIITCLIAIAAVFGYNIMVVNPQMVSLETELAQIQSQQEDILMAVQVLGTDLGSVQGVTGGPGVTNFTSVDIAQDLWVRGDSFIENSMIEMTTTEKLAIAAPTSMPTATPALVVNNAGVSRILELQASGVAVGAVDRSGNLITSGGVTAGGPSVVTAPTAIATATPAFRVNSTGVSRLLELQKNATPVASVSGAGNASFAGTLGVTGASTLSSATLGTFFNLTPATTISVTSGSTITPAGSLQPLEAGSSVTTSTSTAVADGSIDGQVVILVNVDSSDTVTVDGAGANVECGGNQAIGPGDSLALWWDDGNSNWVCWTKFGF